MSTSQATLIQRLSEAIQDYINESTTTNIGAGVTVISTALNKHDNALDDTFNNWWVYIKGTANDCVERKVRDYATATGTLTVYGANLSAESASVPFELGRYERRKKLLAINRTIEEIYPDLVKLLEDRSLITGNILPPFRWSSASALELYTLATGTLAKNTDGAYIWRGKTSAKITASGADDFLSINSNKYPRLLDLMGKTITFKCWVYPEVANDAFLTIYTLKADGTAQTLNSTTACPAGKKTLLELKDQSINDDIQFIEFRLGVQTNTKYVYFDEPRVTGRDLYDYLLPSDFDNGHISKVYIQTSGYSDDICDDLLPRNWERIYGSEFQTREIGGSLYKHIRLPQLYSSKRQLKLIGYCPLEALSADTGTISTDNKQAIDLLIAYAAYLLYRMEEGIPASKDISRYEQASSKWLGEYYRLLPNAKMVTPRGTLNLPII